MVVKSQKITLNVYIVWTGYAASFLNSTYKRVDSCGSCGPFRLIDCQPSRQSTKAGVGKVSPSGQIWPADKKLATPVIMPTPGANLTNLSFFRFSDFCC